MIDNSVISKVKSNIEHREATLSDNKGAIFSILTESVYTYPRLAGPREIVSNALDSTARAKSARPIEIKGPSSLNQTFSVRDFGVGLDDHEIYDLYTSLGSSSKKGTDDEVGFFGIGALSPLAYVESFNVTSYRNGAARLYSIFMGENGVPRVAPMGITKTDQPNGLLVSYNVKREDINNFVQDIALVLKYIEGKRFKYQYPIVYFKDETKTSKDLVMNFNDSIFIINKNYYNTYKNTLVMGGVAYEFDPSYLKNKLFERYSLLIEAPIGAVSIQASREKLKLNTKTLSYIKEVAEFVYKNIETEVQKQVDKAPTFIEALKIVERMTVIQIKNAVWNGHKLNFNQFLESAQAYFDIRVKFRKKFFVYGSNAQKNNYKTVSSSYPMILDDTSRGSLTRIKDHYNDSVLVFIQKDSDKTEEFIKTFGNFFTERASNLPMGPAIAKTTVRCKKKIYKINKGQIYYTTFNNTTDEYTDDIDKFDGYYIVIKNRVINYLDHKLSISDIDLIKNITDKDILVLDWETKELPKLASCFIEYFVQNYYGIIENCYKDNAIESIKHRTKTGFLYKNRKDFKEEIDSINKKTYKINVRDIKTVASKLKLKLPKEEVFNYVEKIDSIIDNHYPLMEMLDYRAYEGKMSKHLKDYISGGNQEVFKGCLK